MKLKLFVLLILMGLLFAGCCRPPNIGSVGINLYPQHTDCWCWAACTEMISQYYGHRVLQHESSNYVHGTTCTSGCSGSCTGWYWYGATIAQIKDNWTHWDFEYKYVSDNLPWDDDDADDVKETISTTQFCKKCPIYTIWWWDKGGGHVVVAYGYAEIGNQHYISYLDPWAPDCSKDGTNCSSTNGGDDVVTTYQAFVDDNIHEWGDTFYDFKYVGD